MVTPEGYSMSIYTVTRRKTMVNTKTGERRGATEEINVRYSPVKGGEAEVVSKTTKLDKQPEWIEAK